jgi:deoxycytidine triphosphate deaminase
MKDNANKVVMQLDGAVLTRKEVKARLSSNDRNWGIYLKPILDERSQIGDGSVDIRLGTHFLVPKASDLSHVSPQRMDDKYVREFQSQVVKNFGKSFILHPNHLVLGVMLEFLALPPDISAMVLSRSNFGRVGLVVATAVYVHPLWKGCLTLELSNYGEIPLELPCGAPIAQLVFFKATKLKHAQALGSARKACPIRPEFARLKQIKDWKKLSNIYRILSEI